MIYEYGDCKDCDGCGEISVFRPRSLDTDPYREVPCPSCQGTGVVPVGVLSAERMSARIEEVQRRARAAGQARHPPSALPTVPTASDAVGTHAINAE